MKDNELSQLEKGDFIQHLIYGLCYVENLQKSFDSKEILGLIIRPVTVGGIKALFEDTKSHSNRLLETEKYLLLKKEMDPDIPFLYHINGEKVDICEWDQIGEINAKGELSVKIMYTLNSPWDVLNFLHHQESLKKIKL